MTAEVWSFGLITDGIQSGWKTLPTSSPILVEWPCQEQHESCSTTSTPVLDISTPTNTKGV